MFIASSCYVGQSVVKKAFAPFLISHFFVYLLNLNVSAR